MRHHLETSACLWAENLQPHSQSEFPPASLCGPFCMRTQCLLHLFFRAANRQTTREPCVSWPSCCSWPSASDPSGILHTLLSINIMIIVVLDLMSFLSSVFFLMISYVSLFKTTFCIQRTDMNHKGNKPHNATQDGILQWISDEQEINKTI